MNKSEGKILLNCQGFAIFRYVDLHFRAQFLSKRHSWLVICMKQNNMPRGAFSSKLRKLGMTSVIGERELGHLKLDGCVLSPDREPPVLQ